LSQKHNRNDANTQIFPKIERERNVLLPMACEFLASSAAANPKTPKGFEEE
jgi:hypothetical protein